MQRLFLKCVALLVVLAGSMVSNVKDADAGWKPTCWKFTIGGDASTDPFPDRIKVFELDLQESAVGSWVQQAAGCNSGTGVSGPANTEHRVLVPMVGTYQKDLDGNTRLMLDGTIQDICFSTPFIYECHIDARLNPQTKNSIPGINGHAYNYCRAVPGGGDYFGPLDSGSPFTTPLTLTQISCKDPSVHNP